MFTGIVADIGVISVISDISDGKQLQISCSNLSLNDVKIGDSIAVNGVCLTVTKMGKDYFCADLSSATLAVSTFTELKQGAKVNLEKALRLSDRLGGHLVAGHVDGIGVIYDICHKSSHCELVIEAPINLAKYLVNKGSITVDGVSLTVGEVQNSRFKLNVIPHTLNQTIFMQYKIGARVNLEIDLIARYLEGLLQNKNKGSKITASFLQQHGF